MVLLALGAWGGISAKWTRILIGVVSAGSLIAKIWRYRSCGGSWEDGGHRWII